MTEEMAFEATYSDWKVVKTRGVVQVILEVPLEASDKAYNVLGGMPNPAQEVWLGVARLRLNYKVEQNNTERPALTPTTGDGHAYSRPPPTLAQQVAMLRKNHLYRTYMEAKDEDECKSIQCAQWGVSSVSHVPDHELNDHLNAFAAWKMCL